ncbi:uncharacterized protein MELLADRAFT_88323 [Melampsora larici-populina 98AG31]|uniref:GCM domain-containing protein n=1 Tax=Melampsora larici-populina (strain 98AG31 / pathotype 3-4-7) TaxID=747676 RepID=F4RRB4_MELLP|nr:uncharacterized protein MELLADRAFT_88323 [Melampsora larici-populina 98AG31]EGG04909.1 hypothetical protein MELLADRAFT_88323 [Melampsora larici-populina 98AG31]
MSSDSDNLYEVEEDYEEEEEDAPLPSAISQKSLLQSQQSKTNTNETSSNESAPQKKKVGKKGKKTFSLPQDRESFVTFIDDNTTLDDEGYPLLPNENTMFVWQPGRTIRFTCLGVLICNDSDCRYRGSPPTSSNKRVEWASNQQKCPAARCPGILEHLQCKDTICRLDEHLPSGWGIVCHSGFHQHPWPRRGKPDKLSLGKLGKKVVKNPEVGPLRLKVGRAPAGKQEIGTASSIHPAFGNLHRTGYYRRKLLVAAGVIPEKKIPGAGDSFLLDMIHWAKFFFYSNFILTCVSSFCFDMDTHMTFQTKWMASMLLTRDENDRIYGGGLILDVTYKFFANGYLLTTSMFNDVLNRWIPIQLTWLNGMTEDHYASHFTTLMRQMQEAQISSRISSAECDVLVRQVVDFSMAQKSGFIMAYMDVFKEANRQVALSKLKGCHEHFRAQVTRIKRNRVIIPADDEATFQKAAFGLLKLDEPGGLSFNKKISKLRKEYPKAKRWIGWWQAAYIQSMLFRSRPKQVDDDGLCDDLSATTNAQESMHRVYYMISKGNCTVQIGLVQLYALVGSLERDYHDLC